jgi:hypothetical protein
MIHNEQEADRPRQTGSGRQAQAVLSCHRIAPHTVTQEKPKPSLTSARKVTLLRVRTDTPTLNAGCTVQEEAA